MKRKNGTLKKLLLAAVCLAGLSACETVDSMRIPSVNVFLDLGNAGLWNTYGVHGYGNCRFFNREKRIPANFPYVERSATGFGGIMLVYGINGPTAYDRACPVEIDKNTVLSFDYDSMEAYCPKCGSRFNVCEADGVPIAGAALENRYGLQRFSVVPSNGGYIIIR